MSYDFVLTFDNILGPNIYDTRQMPMLWNTAGISLMNLNLIYPILAIFNSQ
jgi:hypothetical protein